MQRPRQITVKVLNLNKKSTSDDIFNILKPLLGLDVSLKECEDQPVNYAYVNCYIRGDEHCVLQKLHNFNLHGNKLTAKLKEDKQVGHHSGNEYPLLKSRNPVKTVLGNWNSEDDLLPPSVKKRRIDDPEGSNAISDHRDKDDCSSVSSNTSTSTNRTIKVSISDVVGIDASDLDSHFGKFGRLTNNTIIRQGQPHYAYINFESETAAKAASKVPHHTVCGKIVTVKPKLSAAAPLPATTLGLMSATLPCNSLVIDKAQKDMTEHFPSSKLIQLTPSGDDQLVIYAPEKLIAQAMRIFTGIIHDNEAKIITKPILLNYYHYPLLASSDILEKIKSASHKFDLQIEYSGKRNSLCQFQDDWKKIREEIVPKISHESTSLTEKYQWYWHNGDTFIAYNARVNGEIESAAQANTHTVQVSIGSQNYIIDLANKKQTNTTTGKIREIQQRLVSSKYNLNPTLHLTSHEDYISEIESRIVGLLDSYITEKIIQLSDSIRELDNFVEQLIYLCSKSIVEAVWDKERKSLTIKGTRKQVHFTGQEIQERINAKERELGRISITLPPMWTPQTENCELKPVPKQTLEWKNIEQHFLSGFAARIVKIERIQNKWLWEKYAHTKDCMLMKNAEVSENEKRLFHGTRSNPPKVIYNSEQGFDHRMASDGLYGAGAYFAVKSSYSDGYAYKLPNGQKQMFLVKVLTGVPYESPNCDHCLKVPPKKPQSELRDRGFEEERYDSVTACTGGSRIYVTYTLGSAYPDYLITYAHAI